VLESSLRVVARIKAKPDKIDEVCELLSGLIEPTRKEADCLSYKLLQNRKDPTDFTFIEEWESDSAFDLHATTEHIRDISPKLKEIAAAAPDIRIYSVVG
jgi:quinol monooxygenase YgiN